MNSPIRGFLTSFRVQVCNQGNPTCFGFKSSDTLNPHERPFTWQGSDEGDEVSGRGWAARNADGTLGGHVYFHLGDDSAFRAERLNEPSGQ
jgi:hypothetical protein